MLYLKKIVIIALLLAFTACGTAPKIPTDTTDTTEIQEDSSEETILIKNNRVVWADDGSDIAVVELHYKEIDGVQTDFKHRLYVQNVDGSQKRAITELRDYQNGSLYYMKQGGYFIMESLLPDGMRRFDRIDDNGNEILIIEMPAYTDCPPDTAQAYHTIIPSPDAALLAHIFSLECGEVSVSFLYANNLNIIAEPIQLKINEPINATWHIENYLLLVNNKNDKAWAIHTNQAPKSVPPPRCIAPVTSSSNITYNGDMVYLNADGLVELRQIDKNMAFGCQ